MEENNINKVKEEKVEVEQAEVIEKPYQTVIEDARQSLYKSYKNQRLVSNILMFVIVGAIVGIMFLIISNQPVLKILGYSLAGALVLGMIIYYVVSRKRFPNKTKEYVSIVANELNKRQFSNQEFSDIKFDVEEKLALSDLISDGVYKEATGINSRNVVRGTYHGHHFLYAEAALLRPSTRKQQVPPLFVGKYISVPNSLEFDGRFVFVFKNVKQNLDLPNDIEDLVVLEEKDDFVVYGPEGANYHNAIPNDIIAGLKRIETEGHLLNMNVVFWKGHTAAYISYDDAIMSVPFDKPFDYESNEKSFNDVLVCMNAIAGE